MLGKKIPFKILILILVALAPFESGCEFFGRKSDDNVVTAPGFFADGSTFIGTWSMITANTSATGRPSFAMTSSYTFEPSGSARVDYKDLHAAGMSCSGFGQFRQVSGNEVLIYIQSTNNPNCGFPSVIHLSGLQVHSKSITFTDGDSGDDYTYFLSRPGDLAPVGIWDFDSAGGTGGEGGIDYIVFDPHGYFILQTTSNGAQYQLLGMYTITSTGHMILETFANMDPAQNQGVLMDFSQYVTDGHALDLVEDDGAGGATVYTGYRY